jgi:hypothetical protein
MKRDTDVLCSGHDQCKWVANDNSNTDPTKPPVTDKFTCVSVNREDKGDMGTCNRLFNKEACYDKAFYGKCEWAQVAATKPPTTDPNTDPTKPPAVDPTKPTMNGYCSPLPTITDPASKESCYKGRDKATCDTTKCFWKEVCAATGKIPTDMACSAPFWDTQICRYKCPPTFICMNKDKSAKDTCSKNADMAACNKQDTSCYWTVDPASQC